jgi:hypothetical protein
MHITSGGFTDFEVLIAARRADGVYPVTVIESPAGQADGEFRLPIAAQDLETLLERMRALDTDEVTLTDFGGRFFSALFHDDVLGRYAESVGMTSEGRGLRLRLHIEPPELAALPWELLYDPEKREFVGLSKRTLITRYLHVPRPPSPLRIELPLRLLIVSASPQDLPPLEIDAELARIEGALTQCTQDHLIRFDILRNVTTRALRAALREPYHALHFVGHGAFDDDVGSLAFEDEHSDADLISGRALGTLLKNTSARLVVLNACQSAQDAQNARAFSGVGPALVDAGLPAVVAMQFIVGDASARIFTQDFYEMLSHYLPVDECVSQAREGLMLAAGVESVDWVTPVLYLRAPDGIVFAPEGVEEIEEDELEKAKNLYVGSLSTERVATAETKADAPGQKEIINHLWAMVDSPTYRRWSEPHEALSRWVSRYEDGYVDELSREDLAAVVDRKPVTVVLGEAGMGKTPNLERLAFLYADRALREGAEAPLPVFVKLSQYGGHDSLMPLVQEGLHRHGQIHLSPDPEAEDAGVRALLAERRFIFLLDGLCQIPGDEEEQARGVAVVKRFVDDHPEHIHVITCRVSFYDDHIQGGESWLILPHSDEDVRAFFLRRFGEARGQEIYQGLPDRMRALARTPVLLSLLIDEVRCRGDGAARQRGPLFASFVSRMLDYEEAPVSVESQEMLLAGLAYAMKLDQTTEYTTDQALEILGREMSEVRLWQLAPQEVLDGLLASGLVRTGSTARVAFAHAWFQDYFAASSLAEKLDQGQMTCEDLVGDYGWREAILFLPSMVQDPTALIEKLLTYDPLVAAECLLETEDVNGALAGRIGKALAEREAAGTKEEREEATALLAQLHDAGKIPDVSAHWEAAEAQSEAGDEDTKTTAITMALRGQLVVAEGPLAGLRFPLVAGSRAVLGRSSKADFTLRDDSVSRRHVEIKVEETDISIRDLDSTNGTQVNGAHISDWQPLADGDHVQLGDLPLTVQILS